MPMLSTRTTPETVRPGQPKVSVRAAIAALVPTNATNPTTRANENVKARDVVEREGGLIVMSGAYRCIPSRRNMVRGAPHRTAGLQKPAVRLGVARLLCS